MGEEIRYSNHGHMLYNQPLHFPVSCSLRSPYADRFHPFPQEISGGQSSAVQPPLAQLPIFIPSHKNFNSVTRITNVVDAQLAVTQQSMSVIGQAVEDLTQGEAVPHSQS